MEKLVNQSKRWMAALGAVAFLMVAGWQFGIGSTDAVFTEREVALESAVAGSSVGYYKEYEFCSRYGYSCNELVYKCKFMGSLPCNVSGQIPCSKIC